MGTRDVAFHLFSAAASRIGAGASPAGALLYHALAVWVVNEGLRKRSSGGWDGDGFGAIHQRGSRRSKTPVNIVQETLQTCDPGSGPRVALALIRREGEKHPSSTQGLSQPPASLRGLTWSTGGS